jgi:hypothetical protein
LFNLFLFAGGGYYGGYGGGILPIPIFLGGGGGYSSYRSVYCDDFYNQYYGYGRYVNGFGYGYGRCLY